MLSEQTFNKHISTYKTCFLTCSYMLKYPCSSNWHSLVPNRIGHYSAPYMLFGAMFGCTLKLQNVVVLILVKCFSVFVITSQGVGVMTWESGRMFLLCLLYLPIPIRGQTSSNRPSFLTRKLSRKKNKFTTIKFLIP